MSNGKCDICSILFKLPKARRWFNCILKPRLRNYKSHIKNNVKSCKIVRHFIEESKEVSNLRFIIVDVLNNIDHFSSDEIEDLLLQKEQFWIGTLVPQRKRLNGTHHQMKCFNPVFG